VQKGSASESVFACVQKKSGDGVPLSRPPKVNSTGEGKWRKSLSQKRCRRMRVRPSGGGRSTGKPGRKKSRQVVGRKRKRQHINPGWEGNLGASVGILTRIRPGQKGQKGGRGKGWQNFLPDERGKKL